jgi:UPF0755 protein
VRVLPLLAALALAGCAPSLDAPVQVRIPRGSSFSAATDSLVAAGVVRFPAWFRWQAKLRGADRTVKPGIYAFEGRPSSVQVLDRLARGDALRFRVTLIEGGTLWDLARAVEQSMGIPGDSIHAAARSSALRERYGIPGATVEGWLAPVTYQFDGFESASDILTAFLRARRSQWPADFATRAAAADLDTVEVLSIASIVEAEAQLQEELPRIAAVYRNRLRLGMPLQADPTIQYAFLVDSGARKPRFYNKDYAYPSAYNSYTNRGLPPTPIGNPSVAAIEAVLDPMNSRELYFVARGDGGHVFARTYSEHLSNIRRVRGR